MHKETFIFPYITTADGRMHNLSVETDGFHLPVTPLAQVMGLSLPNQKTAINKRFTTQKYLPLNSNRAVLCLEACDFKIWLESIVHNRCNDPELVKHFKENFMAAFEASVASLSHPGSRKNTSRSLPTPPISAPGSSTPPEPVFTPASAPVAPVATAPILSSPTLPPSAERGLPPVLAFSPSPHTFSAPARPVVSQTAGAMVNIKSVESFLMGKTLVVPSYQRDYAWRERNIHELFADVEEAIEAGDEHYLGAFILSQTDAYAPAQVVDGQQRLTTLILIFAALIAATAKPELRQHYWNTFIVHPVHGYKLSLTPESQAFFVELLQGRGPEPAFEGQVRLSRANQWIRQRVEGLLREGGQARIERWLRCLANMQVLEFIEPNEGKAIRMFQSVNDRGVPLDKMDIVKSLLVYYSNRYLGGELDQFIADAFAQIFRCFSRIKKLAGEKGYQVSAIDRETFGEADVLCYHYATFDVALSRGLSGDFQPNADTVLNSFLKPTLLNFRHQRTRLYEFVHYYVSDLCNVFLSLEKLLQELRSEPDLFLLLVVQDASVQVYPLLLRLQVHGVLRAKHAHVDARSLLDLVALIDLRVLKLFKNSRYQAAFSKILREFRPSNTELLVRACHDFCQQSMPDAAFHSRLVDEDMYQNSGLLRMLLSEELYARQEAKFSVPTVRDLVEIWQSVSVEHVLPQTADESFDVHAYGFDGLEQYRALRHRIGNLILLESRLNSACSNQPVERKMGEAHLYRASKLNAVSALAAQFAPQHRVFNRAALEARSQELAVRIQRCWPIVCTGIPKN